MTNRSSRLRIRRRRICGPAKYDVSLFAGLCALILLLGSGCASKRGNPYVFTPIAMPIGEPGSKETYSDAEPASASKSNEEEEEDPHRDANAFIASVMGSRAKQLDASIWNEDNREEANLLESPVTNPAIVPRAGDTLRILTKTGERIFMTATEMDDQSLLGMSQGYVLKPIHIPTESVLFLELQTQDKGRNYWTIFPVFKDSIPDDEFLSCRDIEEQLRRVDGFRRAMNDEIAKRGSYNTGLEKRFGDLVGDFDSSSNKYSKVALTAAIARETRLLELWIESSCDDDSLKGATPPSEIQTMIEDLKRTTDPRDRYAYNYRLNKILDKVF